MTKASASGKVLEKRRRRERRTRYRRRRSTTFRRLLPVAAAALGTLSWSGAQRFGRLLGATLWRLEARRRARSLEQLALALPELGDDERERIAREAMTHQATTLVESLHLLGRDTPAADLPIEIAGFDHLERVRADERPILLLTGHCGNWEMISAALASRNVQVFAVARELQDPVLHEAILRLRQRYGVETIVRGSPRAAAQMRAALRGRAVLAMLIDQDIDVRGAWVPFFGRPAYTPLGAANVALRCRMAVLPAFDERRSDGSHLVRFHPELELPDDEVEATAAMTRRIEEHVRRRPDQWVWTHRRWRRQPPATARPGHEDWRPRAAESAYAADNGGRYMPIQIPERRNERRYSVPDGLDVQIEFAGADSVRHALRLNEISASGAGFLIPHAIDGIRSGAMIPGVLIRFGPLEIRGNMQILHTTRGRDTSYSCGVQFYPRSEHDRNEMTALVARLAQLQKSGR